MPPVGGPRGPRHTTEGPPSEQARAALTERLRREVADARMRFEEAGLRAETHRLLGDAAAAAEVVREQEQILADVQDRLGRAVSAAVVERDAEQVLADLVATGAVDAPVTAEFLQPAARAPRTPIVAGVSSVVAVVGLLLGAVLGIGRTPQVELTEAAADSAPAEAATDEPSPDAPSGSLTDRRGDPGTVPVAPVDPTASGPTTAGSPTGQPTRGEDADGASPTPSPNADLGTVVRDLIDAVAGLDPDGGSDDGGTPDDLDIRLPGLQQLVDEIVDGADGDGDPTDGASVTDDDGAATEERAATEEGAATDEGAATEEGAATDDGQRLGDGDGFVTDGPAE